MSPSADCLVFSPRLAIEVQTLSETSPKSRLRFINIFKNVVYTTFLNIYVARQSGIKPMGLRLYRDGFRNEVGRWSVKVGTRPHAHRGMRYNLV